MTKQMFFQYLKPLQLPKIYYYETIGSTNAIAMQLLENTSLDDWTLFFAEEQTAGKGRFDRKWFTNPESALAFSIVFRPTEAELAHLEFFSALGGMAICKTLLNHYEIKAKVKYPNDVLINGSKTSGVLAESDWQDGKPKAVVLGIGVNVMPDSIPAENDLTFPATCVANETTQDINRYQLLAEIIEELQNLRPILTRPSFIKDWNRFLAYKDQPIKIVVKEETHFGICKQIDENGDLVLEKEDGTIQTFRVGDVHLRPQN